MKKKGGRLDFLDLYDFYGISSTINEGKCKFRKNEEEDKKMEMRRKVGS